MVSNVFPLDYGDPFVESIYIILISNSFSSEINYKNKD